MNTTENSNECTLAENTISSRMRKCKTLERLTYAVVVLQAVGTAVLMRLLPESIPMHFNTDGVVDRMGSKYELIILVVLNIIMAVGWRGVICEKLEKYGKIVDERQRLSAEFTMYVLRIVGFVTVLILPGAEVLLTVIAGIGGAGIDPLSGVEIFTRIMNISISLMLLIFGNLMPKVRTNGVFGIRTSWSMYNDETWQRSNRIGGYVMVVVGFICLIVGISLPYIASTYVLLAVLLIGAAICIIVSYKVYKDVRSK